MRSAGYTDGSSLFAWYWSQRTISVHREHADDRNLLGRPSRSHGDSTPHLCDPNGLDYELNALIFAVRVAALASLYFWTNVSRAPLFWAPFVSRARSEPRSVISLTSRRVQALALSRPPR
jgi:uncharacterized membrane-anchored protein